MLYPTTFAIETVLGCNLHCVECAVGSNLIRRKHGMMPLSDFIIIADKIKNVCTYLYLHLWGEPMLNKDMFSMIEIGSEFAKTNISTNANTLDAETANQLISSGVKDIIVSIDGMTQEIYEIYRKGGVLNKALANLARLVRFNHSSNAGVNIVPQFVVFKHNKHEINDFAKFCAELGLTATFKAPYLQAGSKLKPSGIPQYERIPSPNPQSRALAMRQCLLDDSCVILLDGSIVPCCFDYNKKNVFGNIFQQPLEEIWLGEEFTQFRNSVKKGCPPKFCMENCHIFY